MTICQLQSVFVSRKFYFSRASSEKLEELVCESLQGWRPVGVTGLSNNKKIKAWAFSSGRYNSCLENAFWGGWKACQMGLCGPCCKNKKLRVTGKPVRNEAKEGIDHQRAKTARIAHVLPKARAWRQLRWRKGKKKKKGRELGSDVLRTIL